MIHSFGEQLDQLVGIDLTEGVGKLLFCQFVQVSCAVDARFEVEKVLGMRLWRLVLVAEGAAAVVASDRHPVSARFADEAFEA